MRGGDGAEIIYSLRNSDALSKKIATELEKTGQNVRKYYQRRLPSNPSKDYYYILRDTPNNESLIIEYGFADSKGDDPELLKDDYESLAEAVVRAVASYVGVPYTVNSSDSNVYIVQSGDTLWSIAKKFGVTVNELKEKNNLMNNNLSIGQVLFIPGTNDENIYIVQSGDSLYSIARKFGMTVDELKALNNLNSNLLSVGQKLKINSNEMEDDQNTYVVKKGDSLYAIAKKYGVSVNDIKQANNITSDFLSIGQVLVIPSNISTSIYTVQKGDSLYSIAREYGTSVDELKRLNNLTSNLLSIGQKLILP